MPILHIIGLPGVGKTTLTEKLAKELKLPIYRIGKYRSKFPTSLTGEADAWVALFCDLSKWRWKKCILETVGLNCRESFLEKALPICQMITIKLEAQRKTLYARIKKKKKIKQSGDWLFSSTYRDKYEFVRKLFKEFKNIYAEIRIDTSNLKPHQVYKIALKKLEDVGVYIE